MDKKPEITENQPYKDLYNPIEPAPNEDSEYNNSFFKPMNSHRVWLILALVLIVIAVIILYVYQKGDRKTILGNQPIPAGQAFMNTPPPVGQSLANITAAFNVPFGGNMLPNPIGNQVQNNFNAGNKNTVQCPNCHATGLPICSACGTIMQPLSNNAGLGLFVCPFCGSVGLPICSQCGTRMSTTPGIGHLHPVAQPADTVGGQFFCPNCNATGLPNWNQSGIPTCPNCRARMKVVQSTKIQGTPGNSIPLGVNPGM